MSASRSEFIAGLRACIAPGVSAAPFGMLFGALAVDNGLAPGEAVLMSAAVFAGASQMVGIELFRSDVMPWLIVFSVFAVNFRHILYSAAVGRHLGDFTPLQKALAFFFLVDPLYAAAEARVERGRGVSVSWYFGMALLMFALWVSSTWIGALFGRLIRDPEALGIDFLLPIYFLGLLLGFRSRPNWLPVVLASGVGSILAYLYVGSPWHVSIGAAAGILVAVLIPLDRQPEEVAMGEFGEDAR